jgi:hypothetical protein
MVLDHKLLSSLRPATELETYRKGSATLGLFRVGNTVARSVSKFIYIRVGG